jgi:hypothetical protein
MVSSVGPLSALPALLELVPPRPVQWPTTPLRLEMGRAGGAVAHALARAVHSTASIRMLRGGVTLREPVATMPKPPFLYP